MSIRVLLADDRQMTREGLRALLEKRPGVEVVGEASDGREAVALVAQLRPDVVIMDITMPGLNGIEATKQILRDRPQTKVLALSVHADRRYALTMLEAGAMGYLLKNAASDELYQALDTVSKGQTYLSPPVAQTLVESYRQRQFVSSKAAVNLLTPREREVLQLLAEGKTSKEIAAALHLSVATVETHRRQITNKVGLHSIAELTKYAIREGLTSLDT